MTEPPYSRSADVYDAIYTQIVDYPQHAEQVHRIIQARNPGAATLLEVACGTGLYAQHLVRHYQIVGLDRSPQMLDIARARIPTTDFVESDMAAFSLGRTFDAVICLFSSTAYLTTEARLRSAIATFAAHTSRGGVIVIEPWLAPDAWRDGLVDLTTVDRDDLKVARVAASVREGNIARMRWAFAVARSDGDVEAYVEQHDTGLFGRGEYQAAFAAAGLEADYDEEGLIGRGLYIAGTPA